MAVPAWMYALVDETGTGTWPPGAACETVDAGPFYPSEIPYFVAREEAGRIARWLRRDGYRPRVLRLGVFVSEVALYYDDPSRPLPRPRRGGEGRGGKSGGCGRVEAERVASPTEGPGEAGFVPPPGGQRGGAGTQRGPCDST